jgi:hypothetical protein
VRLSRQAASLASSPATAGSLPIIRLVLSPNKKARIQLLAFFKEHHLSCMKMVISAGDEHLTM